MTLILRGVLRFVANNLLDGNIVLDVRSTKFDNMSMQNITNIVKSAFPDAFLTPPPARVSRSSPEWEKWLNQLATGELHFITISSSYGAELVALCSDIETSLV
ncbi:MAG: hypothetical protein ACYC9H_04110 [Sulfuricaulis sp.]